MKAKLLRDLYNSHGELFARKGEILECQIASTPGTIWLRKDGYPLQTFATDVEIVEE